jgi:hypothetical protein
LHSEPISVYLWCGWGKEWKMIQNTIHYTIAGREATMRHTSRRALTTRGAERIVTRAVRSNPAIEGRPVVCVTRIDTASIK